MEEIKLEGKVNQSLTEEECKVGISVYSPDNCLSGR
jgi:hypothetical protein